MKTLETTTTASEIIQRQRRMPSGWNESSCPATTASVMAIVAFATVRGPINAFRMYTRTAAANNAASANCSGSGAIFRIPSTAHSAEPVNTTCRNSRSAILLIPNESAAEPRPTRIKPPTCAGILGQMPTRMLTASIGLSSVITQSARLSAALLPPPSAFETASWSSTTRRVTSPVDAGVYRALPIVSSSRRSDATRVNAMPAKTARSEIATDPTAAGRTAAPVETAPFNTSQKARNVIQIVDCQPRIR